MDNKNTTTLSTTNGPAVLLDRNVAEVLIARGYSLFWNVSMGGSYVYTNRGATVRGKQPDMVPYKRRRADRSRMGGQCAPLSRLIMQPRIGQRVRYKNGNRADLRKENLVFRGEASVAAQGAVMAP